MAITGKSMTELGKELGVSRQTIRRISFEGKDHTPKKDTTEKIISGWDKLPNGLKAKSYYLGDGLREIKPDNSKTFVEELKKDKVQRNQIINQSDKLRNAEMRIRIAQGRPPLDVTSPK